MNHNKCILVVVASVLLMGYGASQQVDTIVNATQYLEGRERVLMIKGRTAGKVEPWLWVEAHNGYHWKEEGYNPSYTRLVSEYKPVVKQLKTGQWQIQFISELAEKDAGIP